MIDPRQAVIDKRLSGVRRILVFASGKGGVGKSACATVSALLLARRGLRTGLLDLDFQGASCHLFLGCSPGFPDESRGILPLEVDFGLGLMSIASFTGDAAVPMRGQDLSNAVVELLCVTVWGELDVLVVDMPPGMGDQILDLLRLVGRSECVIVTTRSVVAVGVAGRLLAMLQEVGATVSGVLANMVREGEDTSPALQMARSAGVPHLGEVPYCDRLEGAVGSATNLVAGPFAASLAAVLDRLAL